MAPLFEKIFMLRRHQLIRWGPPQGYMLVVLGFLFIVTFVGLQLRAGKARPNLEATIAKGTQERLDLLAELKTEEQLRAFATASVKEHEKTHLAFQKTSWEGIRNLGFITLAGGIGCLSTGFLMFRASELASQVEEESRKAGIPSGQSDS